MKIGQILKFVFVNLGKFEKWGKIVFLKLSHR